MSGRRPRSRRRAPLVAWLVVGSLLAPTAPAASNGFPHFAISREQLLEMLKSPDPRHHLDAAASLAIRRERAAVEPLLHLVERDDEPKAVKIKLVEALGVIGDERAVPRLIAHLRREPSANVRAEIAEVLGLLGGDASHETLRLLVASDAGADVRARAAVALGRLKRPGSHALLLERLSEETSLDVRVALVQGIGLLGEDGATPAVLNIFVTEPERRLRIAAALALGRLGDRRATPALIGALRDRDGVPEMRQAAALALAWLKDPKAIPALEALLSEPDTVMMVLGIRALAESGRPEAVQPLLKLSRRVGRELSARVKANAPDALLRRAETLTIEIEVVQALGRLGDPRAWPIIEQALLPRPIPATSAEALRIRERQYELRRAAVFATAGIRDRATTIWRLNKLLKDKDPRIRAEAARAIGLHKEPEGAGPLKRALRDNDPEVRWEAARALGALKARDGVPGLLQGLQDAHPRVVAECARSLGTLQALEALPQLETVRRQRQEDEVQEAVAEALHTLHH